MEVRGAAKLRLLLTASLLYLVTTYDTDTGGSHLPEPPSGTAAGGGSAATAAARRTLLQPQHPPPRPQGRLPYPSKRHLQQKQQQDGGAAAASGLRCPPLSRELFAGRARNNTVLYAVANEAQWDFFSNWLHHIKRAGIGYYIVAAADTSTSKRLAAAGEPCFDWVDDSIAQHGLEWGQEGWRRMTWSKVFVLDKVVDWGFNLVVSDVDAVWFRDPLYLFDQNPKADLIFSTDAARSENDPGDPGLSVGGSVHHDFNTGVYLMRSSPVVADWAHAWRAFFHNCTSHDQTCAYELMRSPEARPHPDASLRLGSAWGGRLWLGMLPPSLAMNAHTLYLQQLHMVKQVEPLVVHMTWTYNGIDGKRSRLRDMGLWWADPPAYYTEGSFVTVDLQSLPETPASYNRWNENEDMIALHLKAIHAQLQQAYVGMALAVAAGRVFILPQFVCYCEKIWYGVVRCRVVDAQDMPLPIPCPQDYLFHPGHYADEPIAHHGTPLAVREANFLANPRTHAEVKESVLIIRPSATLACTACVKEVPASAEVGSAPVLLVPPGLPDAQLLPLLEPYKRYRVWRLSFAGVGSVRRAYGGFADASAAAAFDRRMSHITTNFCCRREEEAGRYHQQDAISVQLSMTPEFNYSAAAESASSSA